MLRVLAAEGLALPGNPRRDPIPRAPWPDWLEWKPNRIWAYDFTHFTRARRAAIAILDAILAEDLPDAQQIRATLAFGRGAQVLMDGDVVFLSVFGDHWLITAAGCTARGDRPYDCTVMGG